MNGQSPKTLLDVLQRWARICPDATAYTFLARDGQEEESISYAQLDRKSRAIGQALERVGARNQPAVLLYPAGLDYVTAVCGCVYGGAIAVPAPYPRVGTLNQNTERMASILEDAKPRVVLTNTETLPQAQALVRSCSLERQVEILVTDPVCAEGSEDWGPPAIAAETLAILQYTSGSTSTPRGVEISHGNLLYNHAMLEQATELQPGAPVVSWLPLFHDMGLIGNALFALTRGSRCILTSPVAFLQNPALWLEAISRYRAAFSGGPNFAYDLCVRRVNPEAAPHLDLSCWKVAFNGSEPVRSSTLEDFYLRFRECGLRREALFPCYGLAEASVFVTGPRPGAHPVSREAPGVPTPVVGCGQTWLEQRVLAVDPETRTETAPGCVGEVWVSGRNVGAGYWNRPEETAAVFQAFLADTGEGPFLRTGDLGFLADNQLYLTGRLKDLIIVDGINHYPQDIELTVEQSHPSIRAGSSAAFSVNVDGCERLVVVAELSRSQNPKLRPAGSLERTGIIPVLRRAVAGQHEIRVHRVALVPPAAIPKTSSGKVQRRRCREMLLGDELEIWAQG